MIGIAVLCVLAVAATGTLLMAFVLLARTDARIEEQHRQYDARICRVEKQDRRIDEEVLRRLHLRDHIPPVPGC